MFRKVMSAAVMAILVLGSEQVHAEYPEQPIKIIVPTDAGGSIDGIARIFQRAFQEHNLLGSPVVVVNMPGAGGAVGTKAVQQAAPDGYTIGIWHDGLITSAAMGVTDYDHTSFDIIGSTGFVELGLGALADGDSKTFSAMVDKAKADPGSVKVAVNIGLPVHFIPLMVSNEAADGALRMVQVGGGAKRLASVLGGHTDTALFSVQELVKYQPAGLKPIVVFSEQRVPLLKDVPTSTEMGLDLLATDSRIWLAPKGVPEERLAHLTEAFKKAMTIPAVQAQLEGFGITPQFIPQEELAVKLNDVKERVLPLIEDARSAAQ